MGTVKASSLDISMYVQRMAVENMVFCLLEQRRYKKEKIIKGDLIRSLSTVVCLELALLVKKCLKHQNLVFNTSQPKVLLFIASKVKMWYIPM